MVEKPQNVLGADQRPRFFPVGNAGDLGVEAPPNRHGVALRTWARSLAGMQKEALVASSAGGKVWRLVSDEGPYLDGYDEAPFPLAHMTTGMVASYTAELTALAKQRGITLPGLRLTLHSHYSMEGSALRGTMVGGALPPELEVEAGADVDPETLRALVTDAIATAPVRALLGPVHQSLFTLTVNGTRLNPDRVRPLAADPPADPGDPMAKAEPDDGLGAARVPQPLVRLLTAAERVTTSGGVSSSFAEKQSRRLHVRGTCTLRTDGVKQIELGLRNPVGSTFHFLSEEAPAFGGGGRAPDAATYISAGIAFCFMTQLGRYAKITRKPLEAYRLVQDTHLPVRAASGDTASGFAAPVESHVYLDTPEGEAFARQALDMSEQTCFLHALCRTELQTQVIRPT
ncbi:MAG: hypothetical protein ACRDOO_22860 [Actinomadura sp.]